MIGKTKKGRGFRGLLNYIHQKDGASCIGGNMESHGPRNLAREFGVVRKLRPNLKVAVAHHSLSLPPGESLAPEQWNAVARRLLLALGYENCPYVVYLHRDTDHEHIHIVASRIAYDGRVVSDSNDYYRSMAEIRRIERDYGLTFVRSDGEGRKPASTEERHAREGSAAPDLRRLFQDRIEQAARGAPDMTSFVERLRAAGVGVVPNVASTGRVTGLSYILEGQTFKGSDLGKSFSWRGVLERLGVPYLPDRDLPALLAARAAAREGEKRPDRPSPEPEAPQPALPSVQAPERREREIRTHLAALGSERFSVQLLNPETGEVRFRSRWTIDRVVQEAAWLERENARGADILVRPEGDLRHLLLSEVSPAALRDAEDAGYQPAVTVQLAPDRLEVWLRHGDELAIDEARTAGAKLAERFRVDPERAPGDFGHLAGFPTWHPPGRGDREGEDELAWATVLSARGLSYSRSRDTIAGIRWELDEKTRAAAIEAELRNLDRPFSSEELAAAAERLAGARAAHAATRGAIEAAPPADLARAEAELAATLDELRRAEAHIEEVLGAPLPPGDLALQDLGSYLDLKERCRGSELRLETALDTRDLPFRVMKATRLAAVELRRELDLVEQRLGIDKRSLDERLDQLLARHPEPLASAAADAREARSEPGVDTASARRGMPFRAELALETHLAELSRFSRQLAREHDAVAGRLDAVIRRAEQDPDYKPDPQVHGLVSRLNSLENRLRTISARIEEIERLGIARDVARIERSLAQAPTAQDLQAYSRLLARLYASENHRSPSDSSPHAERLAEELKRARQAVRKFERSLGPAPSAKTLEQYKRYLARLHALEDRSLEASRLSPSAEGAREGARQAVRKATETLLARPSAAAVDRLRETVESAIELRSRTSDWNLKGQLARAKKTLDAASEWLRYADPRSVSPTQIDTWRRALARYHELEGRWAERLAREWAPQLGTPESLKALAGRVVQGDRTPETLARLHREIVVALGLDAKAIRPRERAATISAAITDLTCAGTDLQVRARRLLAPEPATPYDLHYLRVAVSRYQSAAQDAARFAAPTRCLQPSIVVESPRFRDRPDRAAAAWAAHAASRGASVREIGHRLARAAQRMTLGVPHALRPKSTGAVGRAAHLGLDYALYRTAFRLEQKVLRPIKQELLSPSGLRNYTRAMTIATTFRQVYQLVTAPTTSVAIFAAARLSYSLARRFVLGRTRER